MKRFLCQLLVFGFAFGLFPGSVQAEKHGAVTGLVVEGKAQHPVAGIRVMAWPVSTPTLGGKAPFVSKPTAADGQYSLMLPPGAYYFIAEGNTHFSYHGPNPVRVSEQGFEGLNLLLAQRTPPPVIAKPKVTTGILGQVTFQGKPIKGAAVTVYADLNSQLRGQGLGQTLPTGEDGVFEAELPPGTYYLVARQHKAGVFNGPLRAGDFFGYFPGNPVHIKQNELVRASIGTVEVPEMTSALGGKLFGKTRVSGQVVDSQGRGVAGVQVMLYEDPAMSARPLHISSPTAVDGKFSLAFPKGGVFWISARSRLGGRPMPGEFYGSYSGSPDGSIKIATDQVVDNVKLQVEILQ